MNRDTDADERMALPASAGLSRGTRWAVGVGAGLMGLVGVLLLFLLTLATNNRLDYERNYNWLFAANVVVAGLLLAILVWGGIRLAIRLQRGASAAACCSSWPASSRWWDWCRAC